MRALYGICGVILGMFLALSVFGLVVWVLARGDGPETITLWWLLCSWIVALFGGFSGFGLAVNLHDSVQSKKLRLLTTHSRALPTFVLGALALSASVLLGIFELAENRTPEELAAHFPSIRPGLESLVELIKKDPSLLDSDRKFPTSKSNNLEGRLKALGIDFCYRGDASGGEIDFLIPTHDPADETEGGYAYLARPPRKVVPDFDRGDSETSFQHLDGHWYVYSRYSPD
jgi:hypothetical protein